MVRLFTCSFALALAAPAFAGPAHSFRANVDGEVVEGYVALPSPPYDRMVVVAHGRSHRAEHWQAHLEAFADAGVVAVAVDYSDTFVGLEQAAVHLAAGTRHFQDLYGIDTTVLLGVSMGGIPSGMALADEVDVYDWWVDVEGVTNLADIYAIATVGWAAAVEPDAKTEIETECGGTPLTAPACYASHSSALRAAEIAGHGLQGVVVVHAPYDGLVPYTHARELTDGLVALGVPVELYTVLGRDCRTNAEGNTTIVGHFEDDSNPECLAGHARETLADHVVMKTGFDRIHTLLAGEPVVGYSEIVVDEPAP